jgi:hypothetical protein
MIDARHQTGHDQSGNLSVKSYGKGQMNTHRRLKSLLALPLMLLVSLSGCGSATETSTHVSHECAGPEREAKPLECEERKKREARQNPTSGAAGLENVKIAAEAMKRVTEGGVKNVEGEDSSERDTRAEEEIRQERGLTTPTEAQDKEREANEQKESGAAVKEAREAQERKEGEGVGREIVKQAVEK